MIPQHKEHQFEMVPVDLIDVLNPRERNGRVFDEIVENIRTLGLKKPITVTPRTDADGQRRYKLVCGEGRLKAFKKLGEREIPALILNASDEDAFIMSLAENIARRQARPLELMAAINQLRSQGYTKKQIAEKTGMHTEYIGGILHLMDSGEERLLVGVESGRIPLTVALSIAKSTTDADVQLALQDAYETGKLRGGELAHARRIVDRRRAYGPARFDGATARQEQISTNTLIRIYQREVERQRRVVRKADIAQQKLLFIVEALRQLLIDENFVNLLRAEGLETMPKQLADRVWATGATP